jgi:hypothetical protein
MMTRRDPKWVGSVGIRLRKSSTKNRVEPSRDVAWLRPRRTYGKSCQIGTPFNFFSFLSYQNDRRYPFGFDKTTFQFTAPPETDRTKWSTLKGINLLDGQTYQISMVSPPEQVIPFQIIFANTRRPIEITPDDGACDATRRDCPVGRCCGRTRSVGKQIGGGARAKTSMLDFYIQVYGPSGKFVVADPSDRKKWASIGVRRWMRETKLSQKAVCAILSGKGVRPHTFAAFKSAARSIGK